MLRKYVYMYLFKACFNLILFDKLDIDLLIIIIFCLVEKSLKKSSNIK